MDECLLPDGVHGWQAGAGLRRRRLLGRFRLPLLLRLYLRLQRRLDRLLLLIGIIGVTDRATEAALVVAVSRICARPPTCGGLDQPHA